MNPYSPAMYFDEYIKIGVELWNLIFKEQLVFVWLIFVVISTISSVAILAYSGLNDDEAEIIILFVLFCSIVATFWIIPNAALKTLLFIVPITVGLMSLILLLFRYTCSDKPTNQEVVKMGLGFVCFLITLSGVVFPLYSTIWYGLMVVFWGVYASVIAITILSER